MQSFDFARTPKIIFGAGTIDSLGSVLKQLGRRVLLLTGGSSLARSGRLDTICATLSDSGFEIVHRTAPGEPSPEQVDNLTECYRANSLECVCAIGGGSVIDCGKAVSAMAPLGEPVVDYLEGVGDKAHPGIKAPLVACPTTAGTGSEATKNAVISSIGQNGFKKSLRHESFVPNVAIIDPQLTLSCPRSVTASCGMDAFTQLLESHVSPKASPLTDTIAVSGMVKIKDNLLPACTDRADDLQVRAALSYGALCSGITLANAGLGIVHALASTIGGKVAIPHGTVCGALLASATETTIQALQSRAPQHPVLRKYAAVGSIVSGRYDSSPAILLKLLVEGLKEWAATLSVPGLGTYGITCNDIIEIAGRTDPGRNAFPLTPQEVQKIIGDAL